VVTIKKYSNRRLYDTDESRYITLEELTAKIRKGSDVRVVDAKSGEDLTQATLTQIILEGPSARVLPVSLLTELVRMQDDALAEFFSRYVSAALELYRTAKHGAQSVAPYFPFATMPFNATNAIARLFNTHAWPDAPPPPREPAPEREAATGDVAEIRRELDELKRELRRKKR
jgi:polyhydroxyalkanoate synthesis repressor PhaR